MSVSSAEHFTCVVCDRFFKDLCNLQLHMGVHIKEVCSKCSICGEALRNRYNFGEHMFVHTNEELFKCDVCCKGFGDILILMEHMRIHTLVKYFQCDICSRTFKNRGFTYNHMRTHLNDKPCTCTEGHVTAEEMEDQLNIFDGADDFFKCSLCNKAFSKRFLLKEHVRIHTNEKPFKCSICGEAFRLHGSLRKHMHVHSNEILYRCKVCFDTFKDKETRENHMKTHSSNCTGCRKELIETDLQDHLEICPAKKLNECRDNQKGVSVIGVLKRPEKESLKESPRKLRSARFDSSKAKRTCSVSEDILANNGKSLPVDEGKSTNMKESHKKLRSVRSSVGVRKRTFSSISENFVLSNEKSSFVVTAKDTNVFSDCSALESEKRGAKHSVDTKVSSTSKVNLKSFRFMKSQKKCSLKDGSGLMMNYINVSADIDEEEYKCDVCHEVYKDKRIFWQHVQTHSERIPLRCRMCLEIFDDKDSWECHGYQKCRCALCGKALSNLDVKLHSNACPVNNPFKCNICCKRFSDDNIFKDHMREHSKEESCKCKVCGEFLFLKYDAQKHKELHRKAVLSAVVISQSKANFALDSFTPPKPNIGDSEPLEQNSSNVLTKLEESEDCVSIKEEEDDFCSFPNTIKEEISFSEDRKDYGDLNFFVSDVDPNNTIIMVDKQEDFCIDESLVDPLA